MKSGVRLTPYLLLAVLTLGTGLGIGLGLSEAPRAGSGTAEAAGLTTPPTTYCATPPTNHTLACPVTGVRPLPRAITPVTLPPGTNVIEPEAYPPVVVPNTPCTTADLSAAITDVYPSMAEYGLLLTVRSSTPCFVEGYPALSFLRPGAQVATDVEDGNVPGSWAPASRIAVDSGAPASFLIEFGGGPGCEFGATATSAFFGLPGHPATIPIAPNLRLAPNFCLDGSTGVTPFEQGNSLDQYA